MRLLDVVYRVKYSFRNAFYTHVFQTSYLNLLNSCLIKLDLKLYLEVVFLIWRKYNFLRCSDFVFLECRLSDLPSTCQGTSNVSAALAGRIGRWKLQLALAEIEKHKEPPWQLGRMAERVSDIFVSLMWSRPPWVMPTEDMFTVTLRKSRVHVFEAWSNWS